MRGSLLTLQRLVQLFPSDTTLKNDLGVGYLLMGDNDSAKKVYEEVSTGVLWAAQVQVLIENDMWYALCFVLFLWNETACE